MCNIYICWSCEVAVYILSRWEGQIGYKIPGHEVGWDTIHGHPTWLQTTPLKYRGNLKTIRNDQISRQIKVDGLRLCMSSSSKAMWIEIPRVGMVGISLSDRREDDWSSTTNRTINGFAGRSSRTEKKLGKSNNHSIITRRGRNHVRDRTRISGRME